MKKKFNKQEYIEDLKYRQGRSKDRMEKIYKGCFAILCAGFVLFILGLVSSLLKI